MHPNIEGDVVNGMAQPVVRGVVGPNFVGMDMRRFSHKKNPSKETVEGRRFSRLLALTTGPHPLSRPPCPGGQVGMGVGPHLNVALSVSDLFV